MRGLAIASDASTVGGYTIEYHGSLNAGYREISLTGTAGYNDGLNGYNFVGNPYSSAIDWDIEDGWSMENVDAAVYFWNPKNGNYGCYVRYDREGTNGSSPFIPAHEGFIVRCGNDGGGKLGVFPLAQVHQSSLRLINDEATQKGIKLCVKLREYQDEVIVKIDENSSWGFDPASDAFKLNGLNEAPQLYLISDYNSRLSVNSVPLSNINGQIDLGFTFSEAGNYKITASEFISLQGISSIYLLDQEAGRLQDMIHVPEYAFEYKNPGTEKRFKLSIIKPYLPNSEDREKVKVFSYGQKIVIENNLNSGAKARLFDISGDLITGISLLPLSRQQMDLQLRPGIYVVAVVGGEHVVKTKVYLK
jgi:hypothetical protein